VGILFGSGLGDKQGLGVFEDKFTIAVDESSIAMFKVVPQKRCVPIQTS
jgi:hypothetical protein